MCLCHTVNHTIYIIERRGGFARRDGGTVENPCGLLSVKRRCGASVWTDSSTSCAPSRTRRAAENGRNHGMDAPRGGQRDSAGRYGARDLSAAASRARRADRRWRCRFRSRACAGVTPRSGELRTCTCRPVPWARRDISRTYARCVALTGISHTRAGLRRKPGAGREGEAKAETSSTTAKGGTYDQGTRNFLAGRPPRKTPLVGGRTPVL